MKIMVKFLLISVLFCFLIIIDGCKQTKTKTVFAFVCGSSVFVRDNPGLKNSKRLFYLNYFDVVQILSEKTINNQKWLKVKTANKKDGWILGKFIKLFSDNISDKDLYQFLKRSGKKVHYNQLPRYVIRKIHSLINPDDEFQKTIIQLKSFDYYIKGKSCVLYLRGYIKHKRKTVLDNSFFKTEDGLFIYRYLFKKNRFVKNDLLLSLINEINNKNRSKNNFNISFGKIETKTIGNNICFIVDISIEEKARRLIRKVFFVIKKKFRLIKIGEIIIYEKNLNSEKELTSTLVYRHWESQKRRIWVNYVENNRKTGHKMYYRVSYWIEGKKLIKEYIKHLD